MTSTKTIASGAEAIIQKSGGNITKNRISKSYRFPELDEKLRKLRTRSETRLLLKAAKLVPTPKVLASSEKTKKIQMQFISGKKLSEHLDKLPNYKIICKQIGRSLAKLHDADIIHGDLTTSNLIIKDNKVFFIDFGLGFHSHRIEDKAVDLHLIRQALEAKHPKIYKQAFHSIIQGYKSSSASSLTLKQLEKVEKRGRYKAQY
jgi:TP53 regulating kinase and related kinases